MTSPSTEAGHTREAGQGRRDFLLGAALASTAAPFAANAGPQDPLLGRCAEWWARRAAVCAMGDALGAEHAEFGEVSTEADAIHEAAHDALNEVGREICATHATSIEGLHAQLRYFLADFGEEFETAHGAGFEKIISSLASGLDAAGS